MTRKQLLGVVRDVLRVPAAPYHEQAVRHAIERFAVACGVASVRDRAGNVLLRCNPRRAAGARNAAPLVLVAHMDHPGFEVLDNGRVEFLGNVPREMFHKARLLIHGRHQSTRARIVTMEQRRWPRRKIARIVPRRPVGPGDYGFWDLPGLQLRRGRLYAPAIDDLLGVAVILAALRELSPSNLRAPVWGLFTRAEEVGFHGAIRAACSGLIPKRALVVSVEMSSQRPAARVGDGPVVRVGDRVTTFDPAATWFLQQQAERCRATHRGFVAQRALMDGGTCEATAFAAHGYRVGGLCLPLGNYHNIGPDRRPRREYVSVEDLENLLRLIIAAALAWPDADPAGDLRRFIKQVRRRAPRRL
jgi:putative aminopeptidase FrvX